MQNSVPGVSAYVPASQFVHVTAAVSEYCPIAHSWQLFKLSLASLTENVPAGQSIQPVLADTFENVPATQLRHAASPSTSEYVPGAHAVTSAADVAPSPAR